MSVRSARDVGQADITPGRRQVVEPHLLRVARALLSGDELSDQSRSAAIRWEFQRMRLHVTLARTGALVFTALLTVTLLTAERTPADAATATASRPVAAVSAVAPFADVSNVFDLLVDPTMSAPAGPVVAVLGAEAEPPTVVEPEPEPVAVPAAPAPIAVAAPVAAGGGYVLASWYGPGFYGNRTACGQVYSPQIIGVAHKTLPCGTLLVLSYGGRTITAPVIDRGPYVAGRTLDLSNATKLALGCTDLCTLMMQFAR